MSRTPEIRKLPRKAFAILLAALLFGPVAVAGDGTVARLSQMSGNVLVSSDSNIASVEPGMRLRPGMRVLTTAGSTVTVEFDGGCRLKLDASQRFQVAATPPCGPLAAAPQSFADSRPARRS